LEALLSSGLSAVGFGFNRLGDQGLIPQLYLTVDDLDLNRLNDLDSIGKDSVTVTATVFELTVESKA